MHFRCRSLAIFVLSIATILLLSSEELFSGTQTSTATKDPAALAALAQMVAATGWNPLNLPADAVVTGSVTRSSDQVTSAVTLKIKGLSEFKADVLRVYSLRHAAIFCHASNSFATSSRSSSY